MSLRFGGAVAIGHPAPFRNRLRVSAAVVCLVLTALLTSCQTGPSAVERLLNAGKINSALKIAARTDPAERSAVAEILLAWVCEQDPGLQSWHPVPPGPSIHDLARTYLSIFSLDPTIAEAYLGLALLAAEYPSLDSGDLNYTTEGLAAWEGASEQYPQLGANPVFNLAGRLLTAAAGSDRPDTLAQLAETGELSPGPLDVVLDCTLPGLEIDRVFGAAGGWIALDAERPGGEHVGCVVSAADGSVRWCLESCSAMSLSPTGRYVVWLSDGARTENRVTKLLDTKTGASRALAAIKLGGLSFGAAWSSDDSRLTLVTQDGLMLFETATGNNRVLVSPELYGERWSVPFSSQWVADDKSVTTQSGGAYLFYEGYAGMDPIRVLDPDTGAVQRIHVDPLHWSLGEAVWSPDGRRIAFNIGPNNDRWVQVDKPGTGASMGVLAAFGQVRSRVISWSPDSTKLLLRMNPFGDQTVSTALWVWDSATEDLALITGCALSAVWGTDGTIYFRSVDAEAGQDRLVGVRLRSK